MFEPGSMDITQHKDTYAGFMTMTKIGIVSCILLLVLMALFLL